MCNITCWKDTVDIINAYFFLTGVRIDLKYKEGGEEFFIFTLYGPYDGRKHLKIDKVR